MADSHNRLAIRSKTKKIFRHDSRQTVVDLRSQRDKQEIFRRAEMGRLVLIKAFRHLHVPFLEFAWTDRTKTADMLRWKHCRACFKQRSLIS